MGKALEGRCDGVVLATKAFHPMGDDPNQRGSGRARGRLIRRTNEASPFSGASSIWSLRSPNTVIPREVAATTKNCHSEGGAA